MSSQVYYKFKSNLKFETLEFDGSSIFVRELRKFITDKCGLHSNDCDLIIEDINGKVFTREDDCIPKYTSIIVRRVPKRNIKPQRKKIATKENMARQDAYKNQRDFSSDLKFHQITKVTNLANSNLSENQKIRLMMEQSSEAYNKENYLVKGKLQDKVPPPTYTCHKCNTKGHWITECPGLRDKDGQLVDPKSTKRPTGIPRDFLIEVDSGTPGAYLNKSGSYMVPITDAEAYAMSKEKKRPFAQEENPPYVAKDMKVPSNLTCPLCKSILKNAVLVKCCGSTFCDDCIMGYVFDMDVKGCKECPKCKRKIVDHESSIYANNLIRDIVQQWLSGPVESPTRVPEVLPETGPSDSSQEKEKPAEYEVREQGEASTFEKQNEASEETIGNNLSTKSKKSFETTTNLVRTTTSVDSKCSTSGSSASTASTSVYGAVASSTCVPPVPWFYSAYTQVLYQPAATGLPTPNQPMPYGANVAFPPPQTGMVPPYPPITAAAWPNTPFGQQFYTVPAAVVDPAVSFVQDNATVNSNEYPAVRADPSARILREEEFYLIKAGILKEKSCQRKRKSKSPVPAEKRDFGPRIRSRSPPNRLYSPAPLSRKRLSVSRSRSRSHQRSPPKRLRKRGFSRSPPPKPPLRRRERSSSQSRGQRWSREVSITPVRRRVRSGTRSISGSPSRYRRSVSKGSSVRRIRPVSRSPLRPLGRKGRDYCSSCSRSRNEKTSRHRAKPDRVICDKPREKAVETKRYASPLVKASKRPKNSRDRSQKENMERNGFPNSPTRATITSNKVSKEQKESDRYKPFVSRRTDSGKRQEKKRAPSEEPADDLTPVISEDYDTARSESTRGMLKNMDRADSPNNQRELLLDSDNEVLDYDDNNHPPPLTSKVQRVVSVECKPWRRSEEERPLYKPKKHKNKKKKHKKRSHKETDA